jgi:hypothetical protein
MPYRMQGQLQVSVLYRYIASGVTQWAHRSSWRQMIRLTHKHHSAGCNPLYHSNPGYRQKLYFDKRNIELYLKVKNGIVGSWWIYALFTVNSFDKVISVTASLNYFVNPLQKKNDDSLIVFKRYIWNLMIRKKTLA